MPSSSEDWSSIFWRAIDGYKSEAMGQSVTYDRKRLCTYMKHHPDDFTVVHQFAEYDLMGWISVQRILGFVIALEKANNRLATVPRDAKRRRAGGEMFTVIPRAAIAETR